MGTAPLIEEQGEDIRASTRESANSIGDLLSNIADSSESLFGIRPNEMGVRILEAMFTGKPLAPLLNIDANQIDGTFEVARAKIKAGELHDAVKLLRVLVMVDFYSKRHWMMLALSLRKLGLFMSAGDSYCVAHIVDRSDLWPLLLAVECYLEARDLSNAEEMLDILNSLLSSEEEPGNTDSSELTAAISALAARVFALRAEVSTAEMPG